MERAREAAARGRRPARTSAADRASPGQFLVSFLPGPRRSCTSGLRVEVRAATLKNRTRIAHRDVRSLPVYGSSSSVA